MLPCFFFDINKLAYLLKKAATNRTIELEDITHANIYVYMFYHYRGEKAFCSAECRCKQIAIDERKEKEKNKKKKKEREKYDSTGAGAAMMMTMMMNNKPSFELSSATPHSSPMQFMSGVAAA